MRVVKKKKSDSQVKYNSHIERRNTLLKFVCVHEGHTVQNNFVTGLNM